MNDAGSVKVEEGRFIRALQTQRNNAFDEAALTAAALEQTLSQLAAVREENAKLQARVADLEQVVADGA